MALLHRAKTLLAVVLLALLVTVAPGGIEAQEGSEFQLRVRKSADVSNDSVEIIISTDRQLREVPKVYVTRVIDEEGTAPVFTTNGSGETVPIDGPRGPVRHTGFEFLRVRTLFTGKRFVQRLCGGRGHQWLADYGRQRDLRSGHSVDYLRA